MYTFIDKAMAQNDELTMQKLLEMVTAQFGAVGFSQRMVARAREKLSLCYSTTRYCQAIIVANMEKRVKWCQEMLDTGEQFDDVIFTDESTIALERHRKRSYQKKGQPCKMKVIPIHPVKVHVWGAISK